MTNKKINLISTLLFSLMMNSAHAIQILESKVVILDSLSDYTTCHAQGLSAGRCHEALKDWVKSHPADAFQAGKLTRLHMIHWNSIPFFGKAMEQNKLICADEDLKLAVVSALDLPKDGHEEILSTAEKIAFEKCPKELKGPVKESASLDSNIFKNFCRHLELEGLKKAKCNSLK